MLYDLPFQVIARTAILSELSGAADTTPVIGHPNPNQPLPFILVGESETADHPAGHVLTILVHVYSSVEGAHEAKALQSFVHSALHSKNFESGGVCYSAVRQEFQTVNIDPDDETWHGVQRFRVTITTS